MFNMLQDLHILYHCTGLACDYFQTHTNDRRHQCSICFKKFIAPYNLKTHMNASHPGEKPTEELNKKSKNTSENIGG